MNHSLRNLLLAIGLFAIALACCIACSASVNVFACALGLAVLPALWMLTGKAELFFAIAYPLTIFALSGGMVETLEHRRLALGSRLIPALR